MKKPFVILAAITAAGCLLTAAGCGGSNKNRASLASNWYADTTFGRIQPTLTDADKEMMTYAVSFRKPSTGNPTYSVEYGAGTYTTEFYAKNFEYSTLPGMPENYKSGYANSSATGDVLAYYYQTEFSVDSVTFKYNGNEKVFGEQKMVTECYFLPVANYLRPLYSKQEVKCATPANYQAGSLSQTYVEVDRSYETFYNYSGSKYTTVLTDNLADGKQTVSTRDNLDGLYNTLFDVCQIDIAVRAMGNFSSSLSQAVNFYTPNAGINTYVLSGGNASLSDDERKDYADKLKAADLFTPKLNEDETEQPLKTVSISVNYDGELHGVSQTYWFAAIDNKRNNTTRATLLRLSTPLPYSLGTIDYKLDTINSTFWNK